MTAAEQKLLIAGVVLALARWKHQLSCVVELTDPYPLSTVANVSAEIDTLVEQLLTVTSKKQ